MPLKYGWIIISVITRYMYSVDNIVLYPSVTNMTEIWQACLMIRIPLQAYIIFVWRKHENMSPCTGSRVYFRHQWIASCAGTQFPTWATPPPTIMPSVLAIRSWPTRRKNGLALAVWYRTPAQQWALVNNLVIPVRYVFSCRTRIINEDVFVD